MEFPVKRKMPPRTEPSTSFDSDGEDDRKMAHAGSDVEGPRQKSICQNHSEIEKRRRDKMNTYIWELSSMIPMCNAINRKLDKLTVLRMAVQHIKTLQGADNTQSETSQKPAFLSDEELKHLIMKSAGGFLFVVGCDRGKILYVSESVQNSLNITQCELTGHSLFDTLLHPKDIPKVKEQMASADLGPRERFIDAKTMKPVLTELPQIQSQFSSGARRSFFCRMKCVPRLHGDDSLGVVKEEKEQDVQAILKRKKLDRRNYALIHCTGYIKSWPLSKIGLDDDETDGDGCNNMNCLVAVGKVQQGCEPNMGGYFVKPTQFTSRHAIDGKFVYVDQRTTAVLGYLPQELLSSSVYEYYHPDDLTVMAEVHRKVLEKKTPIESGIYRFKVKDGSYIGLQTTTYSFTNPWTKEIEYIVANHTVESTEASSSGAVLSDNEVSAVTEDECTSQHTKMSRTNGSSPVNISQTRAGAGRIGRLVADEVLEQSRKEEPVSVKNGLRNELNCGLASLRLAFERAFSNADVRGADTTTTSQAGRGYDHAMSYRQSLNQLNSEISHPNNQLTNSILESAELSENPNAGDSSNDEAAMAVIMSLLEADAGLGGPVDFSDIPWPL